jgi:hypothetical protein
MGLGKFVTIMTGDPARTCLRFGPHRQLHKVCMVKRAVHQTQRSRMHHVLCIVENNRTDAFSAALFILTQRAVQPVQAIGFGGWTVPIMQDNAQARIVGLHGERGQRRLIIAINAYIDTQILLRPAFQTMADHRPDHGFFMPGRNHYGSYAF